MKRDPLCNAVRLALTGLAMGTLAACGGGGSGSGSSTDGGSAGTSTGPITGFGSVYVNGVRFDTDSAEIRSDDGIEREDQLEKGMILTVRGDWDDRGEGRAGRLEYDDTLRGRLTSATWDDIERTGVLIVAGQVVQVDGRTVFKGATPVQLGDATSGPYNVRVSAWRLADGTFRASYVGARTSGSFDDFNEVEVEGPVANLDTDAQTFEINGFGVNYESSEFDDDLSRSELGNGLYVEVEGFIENGVLIAEEIEDEDDDDRFDDDDDVEFSGPVAGDYNPDTRQFMVNGVTVQVTDNTEFDDGLRNASDLVDGMLVSIEGQFRNGIVIAEEIDGADGDAELEASISAIDLEREELVVGGVRVVVTSGTLLEDDDDDDRDRLKFDELRVGDYLEIEGFQRSNNGAYLEAIKIERDDDGDDFEMEANVEALTDVTITVLGLELRAGGQSLAGIRIGSRVEVDYRQDQSDYTIEDIELEDDD